MAKNPIVDEIHRIRKEMLAGHGGDLGALVRYLQRQAEKSAASGRRIVPMPPRTAQRSTAQKARRQRGKIA
jgi:hypothetical protein